MWTLIAMALAALLWLVVFTVGHAGDSGSDGMIMQAVRLVAMGLTALTAAQLLQRLLSYCLLGNKSEGGTASSDLLRAVMNASLYLVVGVIFLRYGLGQDVTSVLATSALVTVILGLALQPTLGHLFSGVSIEIERPLRVGDYVRRDDLEGQVISLSWRSVSLLTDRGTTQVMPNAEFTSRSVEIIRASQPSRHQVVFHMASDSSPSRVMGIALQVLRSNLLGVSRTPAPSVVILGADPMTGTLRFAARFFTLNFLDRSRIASLFMERLWFALLREGLSMPSRSALDWTAEDTVGQALPRQSGDHGGPRVNAALPRHAGAGASALPLLFGQALGVSAHEGQMRADALQALVALPVDLRTQLLDHGRVQLYGPDERCTRGLVGVVIQGRLTEDRPPQPDERVKDLSRLRARVSAISAAGVDAPLMAPESFDLFLSRSALAVGPLAHSLCPRIAGCTDDVSLAYEVLAESIDDGARRLTFLLHSRALPTTRIAAGSWFGWRALVELEDDAYTCRAAQECAVFVWGADTLRQILIRASTTDLESLAALLQGRDPGVRGVTGERLSAWASATA